MEVVPVVLVGDVVRLEPLTLAHHDALCAAAADGELWKLCVTIIPDKPEQMSDYIREALAGQALRRELPFAIVLKTCGQVVGCTRLRNIEAAHRKLEIGPTFIAASWQRTAVNTESKYLLLTHAFEHMGCIRVEMIADVLNKKSITALLRIGAKPEGILRQHLIMPDGRYRDTMVFSIIDSEWPQVKARLEDKLARRSPDTRKPLSER